MRYEDTSGSVSGSATPEARDDADTLNTGSNGPATGNVITGAGTTTGKAGADMPANGHVVAVRGASGTDSSDSGSSLHVDGRFGTLAIDEHGNYKYVADGHAPQNFRDLFQYTLADSKGGRSVAELVISRGGEIQVSENAQKVVPNPDGTITLPAGVDLNDVHVVGRDLIVTMPDGSQIVIVDGAVFVPQLVIGGVEVPSTNLAALLIDAEPKPGAGNPQSSGGNFEVPVGPLDPGVPLGDLIPPTELHFTPPEFQPIYPGLVNHEPTIEIQPDGQPAAINAEDSVNEKGLPARNEGEPAGSGEIADGNGSNNSDPSEATSGTIVISSQDGVGSVTINGVVVNLASPGQVIHGAYGDLTITGFNGQNILYTYTLTDNTHGDGTHDDFSVTVTDSDGDHATATLVVDIIDDVPTARPDTDSVAAGTYGPETGNVMTGAGTTSGTPGADTVGADDAHLSNVTGHGSTTTGEGSWTVQGQYGVLTIDENGNYSYTRNPGTPGGVSDVFNYTLTDGDGDSSTTTLTINIGNNVPQTGENGVVQLDDDALAGGNPGGVGDDPDSVNATGTLSGSGGDGALTFAVQTSGAPSGFTYVSGGAGVVLVQQDGHTVLTVTVGSDGSYSVVQNAAIDHAAGGNENNAIFTINYTVSDADGDSANGSFNINVDDDTPVVTLADRGTPQLVVDESNLSVNATASFADSFTVHYGADGPAASGALSYTLGISAAGADSGLVDVATGQAVVLVMNGAVVEGHVGTAAGALAFTVSVDASGNVTLDQVRALSHPDASNPDDSVSLSNGNLVTLTATATDHDGDSASQSLNIGQSLVFHDDGPSISASSTQPSLTVDESNLGVDATASFAGVFTPVFGADGAGSVTYSLGMNAGSTGLVDVATGQTIVLVDNAGVIEGHVGNAAGAVAFTVSVDGDGNVTLDQVRALSHPDASNPNDGVSLASDNLVTLTATVTDGDGDQASATANIGQNLTFLDDGPSISLAGGAEPTLTVDETNLAVNATASFAAAFTPVFGADGAGTVGYSLTISAPGANSGLVDVATGSAIVLVNNAGVIEGHVGTTGGALAFTVTVDGSGNVTLDQIRAVSHPDGTNPNDSVTLGADNLIGLTATVTDGDGDHSSVTLNIGQNLTFLDDGPSISASGSEPSLTVDESNLAVNDSTSFAGAFTISYGADGAGTTAYALSMTGANGTASGLVDVATGQNIVLVDNAGVIEGHVGTTGGALAFTVAVDGSGNVTLDQIRAVQHPDGSNPNDSVTLSADNLVVLTATVTDGDGDHVSQAINIGQNLNFLDDSPSITASGTEPSLTVDETQLLVDSSASFAGAFTPVFGADGAGSVAYSLSILSSGANSGLVDTATGQNIVLVMSGDGTFVEGRVGNAAGAVAFTVTVDGSGNVTLDQQRAVVHPDASNPNDNVTLSADNLVQLTATVTDKDGDHSSATVNIGQDLNFHDDAPSANNDSDTINAGGTSASGNVITGAGTNEGVANADAPGADGFGSVTTIHSNGSGLTDTTFSAGVLSVHGTYGTLEIDANGNYTYTRDAGSPGNVSEQFTYTYVDGDGDPASATLTINVNDSAPTLPDPGLVQLDDDALANGNPGGVGDDPNSVGTPGQLAGTGGDGALTYDFTGTNTLPAGFTTNLVDASHLQVLQGSTVVLTVTLNNSTGVFSVVQNAPIDHPAGADENNDLFGIGVQVKDADGDTDPATITINVDDDTPTVVLSGTSPSLTVDETNLAVNDTKSFAGMFTDSFGADGPAAANSVSYTLGINAGATGLTDVATGQAIVLVVNGGVVEGHVGNPGGALAFTVSVDSSGNVTLDQMRALSHPDASNPNDSVSLASDNLVTLTQTITDHDGDQASATANIGQNLNFLDDGPSISLAAGPEPTLTVDETNLAANDTKSFAGSFTSSFGADGAGTVSYALSITGGNGTASGLTDVATGSAIVLVNNAGVIEGHVGTTGGALAFTVTVDGSGNVTLDQIRAVQHPDASNPNDSVTLSADNLVVLTATVTDKDGDHSSVGLNIGQNLNFLDDGPSISLAAVAEPTLTVDETNLAVNDTKSFAGSFTSSFGADGSGAVTYQLGITGGNGTASGLIDVATGSAIVLVNNAGVIEGHVGTTGGALAFTVSVNGSGSVTLDQIRAVSHPDTTNSNDSVTLSADNLVTLTATVTDKDGDHSSATLNIGQNLNFLDDGPSIGLAAGPEPTLTVDESNLAVNDSKSFAGAFTVSYGADGAGTTTYALSITGGNGTASGLTDVATGSAIVLVNNAGVIEGHVGTTGGALAFTVTVDGSGNVTLDQIRAVSHPDGNNPNDSVTLSADNLVVLTATATDRDGDHVSQALNIGQNLNFLDDGPSISLAAVAEPTLTVDETVLATNATASFAAAFTSSYGADGAGNIGYALGITGGDGTLSGLKDTATGQNIVLVQNGNVVEGHVGTNAGALAFTVSVDASGNVTLDQIRAVVHPNTSDPNDNVTLSADNLVTLTATVTDKDGDHTSAVLNIGQNLNFHDDGPTLGTVQSQQASNDPTQTPAVGTLHFTPGADGAGSAMTITADFTGITSGGHAIVMHQNGNVLTGYQDVGPAGYDAGDTTVVFTLTVNPTAGTSGQYVFDLVTPLDPTVSDVPIGGSSSFGAGPTASQILDSATAQHLAVVSGYLTGASFNEATWLSSGTASGLTLSSVNGSTAGWGVANNNFEGTNEFFNWDFGSGALDTQGGVFTPPGGVSLPNISYATYDFINYSAADDISYVVHYTDGTFVSGHIPSANMASGGPNWTFTAAAGKFIADIEMYSSGTAPGKVDLVSVGVQSSSFDKTPSFTVQLTDGDGDPTSTGAFTIHIKDGLAPSSPAAQAALVTKAAPTSTETTTNSNAVLMGAFAAAGIAASESLAASTPHTDLHSTVSHLATAAYHGQSMAPVAIEGLDGHRGVSMLVRDAGDGSAHAAVQSTSFHGADMAAPKGAAVANTGHEPAASPLLHGTSAPVHAEPAASQVTAASIAMPSAAQLAAAHGGAVAGQHNPALGQVLAEALHGGGNSSTIDHVLSSLPSHTGGGNPALEALASHNGAGVPMLDSHAFAGFTAGHAAFSMEAVMVHVDAVQPHA